MRLHPALAVLLLLAGCGDDAPGSDAGSVDSGTVDSGPFDAGAPDTGTNDAGEADSGADDGGVEDAGAPDAGEPDAGGCAPLLVGGNDVEAEGWAIVRLEPATITYGDTFVELATTTADGARTSGQLLLTREDAVPVDAPFALEVVMQVERVSPHNTLDSGAAILGSLTGQVGNSVDRSQMVYLDANAVGWSDDSQSAAVAITDGEYHTFLLAVDEERVATFSVDGELLLTRSEYTTNGTIAIGDQTNDPGVDGLVRIRSVRVLCP